MSESFYLIPKSAISMENQFEENNIQKLDYLYYLQEQNKPIENLPQTHPSVFAHKDPDLSKNSLLFAKSNRIVVIQDEEKIKKEAEIANTHFVEFPWALKNFKQEKKETNFFMSENKQTHSFLDNKTSNLSSNYNSNFTSYRNEEFIEVKPKTYLKSLENENALNDEFAFEDEKQNGSNNTSIFFSHLFV